MSCVPAFVKLVAEPTSWVPSCLRGILFIEVFLMARSLRTSPWRISLVQLLMRLMKPLLQMHRCTAELLQRPLMTPPRKRRSKATRDAIHRPLGGASSVTRTDTVTMT